METADIIVIGGGVIGICIALEARRRFPDQKVVLLEKEAACGMHASGRNSGVLHAGFYYSADSLKAKFSREGNRLLTEYCLDRALAINRCGKVVVASDEADLAGLRELLARGKVNGVELQEVDEKGAREIEPRVRTFERALFSPTTASVDSGELMRALVADARAAGVVVRNGVAYLGRAKDSIRTSDGSVTGGYVINAAGLYADRIAREYGFSRDHFILPFKGLYLYADPGTESLRTHIYPVPNLANPFLGVHFTVTVNGAVKIGPTAIPAFWREQYSGFDGFNPLELVDVIGRQAGLMLRNDFGFRRLAVDELRKYNRKRLVALAAPLADGVRPDHYRKWGKPGIRAQLFNRRERRLEMDFRLEGDNRSFHVLNAVSPGLTCSMPFASYVMDRITDTLTARDGQSVPAKGQL
jgi:L-2-hydroxyglutarate oxidase LhgO